MKSFSVLACLLMLIPLAVHAPLAQGTVPTPDGGSGLAMACTADVPEWHNFGWTVCEGIATLAATGTDDEGAAYALAGADLSATITGYASEFCLGLPGQTLPLGGSIAGTLAISDVPVVRDGVLGTANLTGELRLSRVGGPAGPATVELYDAQIELANGKRATLDLPGLGAGVVVPTAGTAAPCPGYVPATLRVAFVLGEPDAQCTPDLCGVTGIEFQGAAAFSPSIPVPPTGSHATGSFGFTSLEAVVRGFWFGAPTVGTYSCFGSGTYAGTALDLEVEGEWTCFGFGGWPFFLHGDLRLAGSLGALAGPTSVEGDTEPRFLPCDAGLAPLPIGDYGFTAACDVYAPTLHASGSPPGPESSTGFLTVEEGDVAYDVVRLSVHAPEPTGAQTVAVSFHSTYWNPATGSYQTDLLGIDVDGREPSTGPACDPCLVRDIWAIDWQVLPTHPEGHAHVEARAQRCILGGSCWSETVAQTQMYVEPTPPLPIIASPTADQKHAPLVPLVASVADENVVDFEWGIAPLAFVGGKGLPPLNQHEVGGTVSTGGKMSCYPTAVASSLKWFNANGHAGITGGLTDKQLVEKLGKAAGTNDGGTATDKMVDAVKKHLKDVGMGQKFNVQSKDVTLKKIREEFGKGEDLILEFRYRDSDGKEKGHAMAVEEVTAEGDVKVMDPADGTFKTVKMDPTGKGASLIDPKSGKKVLQGSVPRMLDVSPRKMGQFVPPVPGRMRSGISAIDQSPAGYNGLWNALGAPNGWYIAQATATDATGLTMSSYGVFFMDP